MASAERKRRLDFGSDELFVLVLDAQLYQLDASREEACKPLALWNDGVERIELDHATDQDAVSILKNGVPATGVEGEAMSRGSIIPAS